MLQNMKQHNYFDEKERKRILSSYHLLETKTDVDYDHLTFLAATISDSPVAYLSITDVDTVNFISSHGIYISSVKRSFSFSEMLLKSGKDFISINYSENPQKFIQNIENFKGKFKFYAGVTLTSSKGFILGTISILDEKERELTSVQIEGLKAIAKQAEKLFEFRKQNEKFEIVQKNLQLKYQELEKFASLVSHDIKSPLANIISLTELLQEENKGKLDEETTQYLDYLVESSYSLRNYVDGILTFYRSENILQKEFENVDLHQLLEGISHLFDVSEDVKITYPDVAVLHNVNKAALSQIFINLISNGLKYNSKKSRHIDIKFSETSEFYTFNVHDNGDGITKDNTSKIFELFKTLDINDRDGNPGSGIGLATVKKLVDNLGGTIEVNSNPGDGSIFSFSVKKV